MFLKNQKNFKIPKTPKIVPKLSKGVLNMFWGTFSKTFLPSLPLRVESSKSFCTKFKIFSKFQKRAKSFLNCLKVFRTSFGVLFSKKFFLPSVPWRVESSKYFRKIKNFQNSKKAQNRSQKCANAFWTCFEVILSKIFFTQCSMEGRVFEMFLKNQKIFKIPKTPKIVPKLSKSVLNMFWGTFSGNFSLRSVAWRVESSKCF